ncbi:hypothetical protein PVAP13_1KG111411 [Panicum virgatum]|uniref:Uncharacterized protein n=1 Tax=Panicum virgatum TaxID=38727 RepID=A0A8T0XPK5_PANVG|nr:hypothetical protein PVAP13_1KG111411 [Panicum virgatum]
MTRLLPAASRSLPPPLTKTHPRRCHCGPCVQTEAREEEAETVAPICSFPLDPAAAAAALQQPAGGAAAPALQPRKPGGNRSRRSSTLVAAGKSLRAGRYSQQGAATRLLRPPGTATASLQPRLPAGPAAAAPSSLPSGLSLLPLRAGQSRTHLLRWRRHPSLPSATSRSKPSKAAMALSAVPGRALRRRWPPK